MSTLERGEVGKTGERLAANYLIKAGYKVLDLNYYNASGYRIGEIDIIAEDKKNEQLVFIEVKSCVTRNPENALPEANVTNAKLRKIFKAINYFLQKEKMLDREWRLDLITVIFNEETGKADLKHIKAIRF